MDRENKNRMGTEAIVPLLFKLSIPSILSMAIQALYNIVDSIYIGNYDQQALTGLSIAFPIQMILIAIAVGTGIGTSSLISRELGKGNRKKASNAAEHVLLLSIVYGIVLAILGSLFSRNIISIFTNNVDIIDYGTRYIRIILIGSTAMFVPMIANNILRGEGNTLVPMISMLIGSIINIILDPFMIFGIGIFPEWGIEGAAVATVVSRLLSGIFIVFMIFKADNEINVNFNKFVFNINIIKDIYIVGFPAMVMQFLASFMIGGLNIIVGTYNETAIAALGIYFRLQSFVFMPVFGLNQGYMPIIGYNYGHNNPERMKKAIKYGFIVAFTFTTLGFILFQTIPTHLIKLFISNSEDSEELILLGSKALTTISIAFPIIGPAIIGSTTFQAIGKGLPSLTLSFLRQIILLLPLAYILGKIGGVNNIWYSFPLSEFISSLVMVFWLRRALKNIFEDMNNTKKS
ncbi:MATE family efflux transporter [Clostridium sp. D2Q-11]|uniref:MATE family efflux transporter n=1 Tax=Anaeromonas frigoriresistens TaxID=2683708 RepID=A0A942ZAD6_9FIRM|nr:MATE family efflux transporter [Anaeromonas frigoriresistens]MBS4540129.1 MATE family efflux transporter [Anaeromonas frigoriresistens]